VKFKIKSKDHKKEEKLRSLET